MIIAVNTRCITKDQPGECSNVMYDVFNGISTLHKEHTFIYIFDQAYDEELSFPANVIPVVVGPIINTSVKKYFWFNVKIPQLLKKYKAEIFVSPGLCSLATKVPQCLILNDLSFLHSPAFVNRKQLSFYKKHTPGFVKKAKSIIVLSEYSKALISTNYKTPLDKIDVVYVVSDSGYKPVSHQEREEIKDKYADGFEYFFFTGNLNSGNNLIVLLKAFSAFKKRQKSSMKLLIASKTIIEDESFIESFRLFRFKKEVKIIEGLTQNEIAKITASAYAMTYPSLCEDVGSSLINAMKCEVPIVTATTGASPEICGDAALYADPQNFEDIALKMMQLFKDEKLRKDLIEKGKLQVQKFNRQNAIKLVWKTIEKTRNSKD